MKNKVCSISGFTGFSDRHLLKKMISAASYRGPDGQGAFFDSQASLGHTRLSIIGKRGAQPLSNEDGTLWLSFNGEIYNYKKMRAELEALGHEFSTDTDSETIVHAFEEYGKNAPNKFNGMFAFALWDSKQKKMTLCRDRLGVKPLYYARTPKGIIFASEIKQLLECDAIKPAIDFSSLREFTAFNYALEGKTLFKGIREVKPGSSMEISKTGISEETFWRIPHPEKTRNGFEAEAHALQTLLEDSVRLRLESDVEVGAALSGGIDSSAVAALAAKHNPRLKTFTAGFGLEGDEFEHARMVAEHCGTNHFEMQTSAEKAVEILPKAIFHLEQPIANTTVPMTFLLSGFARKKVKTMLVGEGSDEVFAGYPRFKAFSPELSTLPLEPRINAYATQGNLALPEKTQRQLLGIRESAFEKAHAYFEKGREPLDCALEFELENELPGFQLSRIDKLTMAHGLEARTPFLDFRIVEKSFAYPAHFKISLLREKKILRKAVEKILPKKTVHRTKGGQRGILPEFFKNGLENASERVLAKNRLVQMGLDASTVGKISRGRNSFNPFRRNACTQQYWFLTLYGLWHETFIDGK